LTARRGHGTLEAAAPSISPGVRDRIKMLRLVRRWDQAELAVRSGYSAATISQIETGRLRPTDEHIERVAGSYGYGKSFFSRDVDVFATQPWLRAYADASKKEADARVASCTLAVEYIRQLGLHPLPDLLPDFSLDADDPDSVEELAEAVRAAAQIEPGAVVGNMVRAAEKLGCVVLPFESELGRHFGLSVRCDGVPVLCVANGAAVSGDRQRFTVAHEVAHLALHADSPPPADSAAATRMERQANEFAAAFLAPAEALLETVDDECGGRRVTLNSLAEVKRIWGVSIKMLVFRLHGLGVIDADHARSLYKQISKRGWNKAEPVNVPVEKARWFPKVITQRAGTADLRQACTLVAQSIEGNADDLFSFASWETVEPAKVVHLADRRRQRDPV
jgi:Zn-dependent peptidase ImmA (M78 family)